MSEVAVWYMRHHAPDYSIEDSEQIGAEQAAYLVDAGEAVVLGVQFPDGRTIAAVDWEPYQAAKQRLLARAWESASERAANPRPVRGVLDPFRGQLLTVDDGEPDWLGRPA